MNEMLGKLIDGAAEAIGGAGAKAALAAVKTAKAKEKQQKKGVPGRKKKGRKTPPKPGKKPPSETAARDPQEAMAAALDEIKRAARAGGVDGDLKAFRRELFEQLRTLIPQAMAEAKKGRPALLRLLTRFRG